MESKEKRKRKISVFTVFLWIALVITMSVIVVYGVNNTSALEDEETKIITVKVDFSEIFEKESVLEESKIEFMQNFYEISATKTNKVFLDEDDNFEYGAKYIRNEGNIGIYEIEVTNEAKYIKYHCILKKGIVSNSLENNIDLKKYVIESETSKIEYIIYESFDDISYYYGEKITEGKDTYDVKLKEKKQITVNIDGLRLYCKAYICQDNIQLNPDEVDSQVGKYLFNIDGNKDFEILIENHYLYKYKIVENNIELDIKKIYLDSFGGNIDCCYKKITIDDIKDEYNFRCDERELWNATYISKQAKWIDKDKGIAKLRLGYTNLNPEPAYITKGYDGMYIDKLSDEFELSLEYYNDDKWSILETVNPEEYKEMYTYSKPIKIPLDVYNEFYSSDNKYKGKKYVYVKDTKTIYWYERYIALKDVEIHVVYNEYGKLNEGITLGTNKEAEFVHNGDPQCTEIYNITTPNLKYIHTQEAIIKIEKNVEDEIGDNTYNIGIFENETDKKTNNIYKIETKNGKGNIVVEIPNYDKEKEYYIYEVDKYGKKLDDENIKYSNNKIEFNVISNSNIESDVSVRSSIKSDYYEESDNSSKWYEYINDSGYTRHYFETDANNTEGTGEKDYVDNVLNINDIYQANVTITGKASENIKDKEEENISKPDKVIDKNVNTSDINIILYVVIFIVLIVVIVTLIIFIRKRKNNN